MQSWVVDTQREGMKKAVKLLEEGFTAEDVRRELLVPLGSMSELNPSNTTPWKNMDREVELRQAWDDARLEQLGVERILDLLDGGYVLEDMRKTFPYLTEAARFCFWDRLLLSPSRCFFAAPRGVVLVD